jgi:hypothetical protein
VKAIAWLQGMPGGFEKQKKAKQVQWYMAVGQAFREAEAGGLLEPRRSRPPWAT